MATSKKKKVVKKVSKKKTSSATAPIKKSVSVSTPKNEVVKNINQTSNKNTSNKNTSNKNIETKTTTESPFTRNRILVLLLLAFVIIGLGVWTSIKSPKDLLKLSKPFPDEKPPETVLTPSVNQAAPNQPVSTQDSKSEKKVLQPTENGKPTTKAPLPIPLEVAAEYKVLPGDTYKKIAKKTLGDKKRYKEIMQINNFSSPNDLKIGDTIKIPVK